MSKEIPQGLYPIGAETYGGLQNAPTYTYPGDAASPPVHAEHHTFPEGYKPEGGKEVGALGAVPPPSGKEQPVKGLKERLNQKKYGIRVKWLLLGILILIVIIALGAGLGAGLSSRYGKISTCEQGTLIGLLTCRSGNSKGQEVQQSGALNGTRIALATQVFEGDNEESLVMYFQHRTGQIRYMTFANGNWSGGDASTVFAHNAKMNTPIAAVSYVWNGVSFWRVFCMVKDHSLTSCGLISGIDVDVTNVIREVWGANNTQGWELGYLSTYNISPMDDDNIGMVVCWDGPT